MATFAKRPRLPAEPAVVTETLAPAIAVSHASRGPTRLDDEELPSPVPAVLRLAMAAGLLVAVILATLLVLSPPAQPEDEDARGAAMAYSALA